MRFTAEDGRKVNVGICHKGTIIPRYPGITCRRTIMWLHVEENDKYPPIDIEEYVTCSPSNQFCRKVGRLMVRNKFLPRFEISLVYRKDKNELLPCKYMLTKSDRGKVYKALLPEHHAVVVKRIKYLRRIVENCYKELHDQETVLTQK